MFLRCLDDIVAEIGFVERKELRLDAIFPLQKLQISNDGLGDGLPFVGIEVAGLAVFIRARHGAATTPTGARTKD